jgi:DNA polymerase IIIc chi subunit
MTAQIVFFAVKDTQDKLNKLCAIAERHFNAGDPLLVMTADEKARDFVDELFWRLPAESFLPHTASDMPCRDLIVITGSRQNINEAKTIFNLTPDPLFLPNLTIYEFEEHFTPQRRQASEARYRAYRDKDIPIRIES